MRILAVDDDQSILTVLEHALTFSGYDVTTALSAKEALKTMYCAELKFDCLLIDIQMPDIDGIQLTEIIRQTPEYASHPVLMLTAMHDKAHLDSAFQAGATDYLTKPFDFKHLLSRICDARALAGEKSRSIASISNPKNITLTRGVARDYQFDQAAPVKVDGLISYFEFDNYVLELARRWKSKITVLAIKMAAPTFERGEISTEEFSNLLGEFLTCTSAALSKFDGCFSYRGHGTLLCVMKRNPTMSRQKIEDKINMHFANISLKVSSLKICIFVGDPIPIRSCSDAVVFKSLWHATDSVERRFAATKQISVSRFILNRSLVTDDQHRLEQKAYKTIMREILNDIDDELWLGKLFLKTRNKKE